MEQNEKKRGLHLRTLLKSLPLFSYRLRTLKGTLPLFLLFLKADSCKFLNSNLKLNEGKEILDESH